jgi:hypothetical protein
MFRVKQSPIIRSSIKLYLQHLVLTNRVLPAVVVDDSSLGSPPPAGSKNDVFRLRSVSNIVIAPARTGSDNNSSWAVMAIDHKNSGIRSGFILLALC